MINRIPSTGSLVLALALGITASPCLAQWQVDGGNGDTVTIGPGGINVRSGATNLNIGAGGITGAAGGRTQLNITPGSVTGRGGPMVQTNTTRPINRPATTNQPKQTAPAPSGQPGPSLQDQVAQLEMTATGKINAGAPLQARVEKLETDNLGKKGTGSIKDRVEALAKALGVNIHAAAIINTAAPIAPPTATGSATTQINGSQASITTTGTGGSAEMRITETGNGNTQINIGKLAGDDGNWYGDDDNREKIVLNDASQNVNIDMKQQGKLKVNGSSNKIRLTNTCSALIINGSDNEVTADNLRLLVLTGSANKVTWTGEAPKIINNGSGNKAQSR